MTQLLLQILCYGEISSKYIVCSVSIASYMVSRKTLLS